MSTLAACEGLQGDLNDVLKVNRKYIRKTLYKSMILPVQEYTSPAWNSFYQKDINELVQKRALKVSRTPIEPVPLEQRRLEVDLCIYQWSKSIAFFLSM